MKSGKKTAVEVPWENPLIPNKRLRHIYTAMAELRLLEQHLAKQGRKPPAPRTGEEAILASTVLSLIAGDLTSDPGTGTAINFLREAKLSGLRAAPAIDKSQLPSAAAPATRLHLAIGAALAPRKKGSIVLAYLYPSELPLSDWKPIFRMASEHNAPIIFVALPTVGKSTLTPGKISATATAAGVPGIPVDAADAVALYRVVQESLLRARSGGGPVLMECVPFRIQGKKSGQTDPVLNMRDSLLHRKVAEDKWFTSISARFSARLKSTTL